MAGTQREIMKPGQSHKTQQQTSSVSEHILQDIAGSQVDKMDCSSAWTQQSWGWYGLIIQHHSWHDTFGISAVG